MNFLKSLDFFGTQKEALCEDKKETPQDDLFDKIEDFEDLDMDEAPEKQTLYLHSFKMIGHELDKLVMDSNDLKEKETKGFRFKMGLPLAHGFTLNHQIRLDPPLSQQ